MSTCEEVGNRIRLLRNEHGLTQKELSEKVKSKNLSCSREVVNQWEGGRRDIKTAYTQALAEIFNVSCDYILRGIEAENVDICSRTGLTQKTITFLESLMKEKKQAINNKMDNSISCNDEWLQSQVVYAEIREFLMNAILLDRTFGEKLLQAAIQVVYNSISQLSFDSSNFVLPSGTEDATKMLPNEFDYTDRINSARFVASQAFNEFFERLCTDAKLIRKGFRAGEGQNIIKHGLDSGALH